MLVGLILLGCAALSLGGGIWAWHQTTGLRIFSLSTDWGAFLQRAYPIALLLGVICLMVSAALLIRAFQKWRRNRKRDTGSAKPIDSVSTSFGTAGCVNQNQIPEPALALKIDQESKTPLVNDALASTPSETIPVAEVSVPKASPQSAAETTFPQEICCPQCGAHLPSGSRFCGKCGCQIQEKRQIKEAAAQ